MAFDMPIEADQVDDLGLFSSFIRGPIVGAIAWILGGQESEQEKQEKLLQEEGQAPNSFPPAQLQKMIELNQQKKKGIMKKVPRLIGSDISDFGECAIQLNAAEMEHHFTRSSLEDEYDLRRANKRTSWSDESGQNLVEYIGDETSSMHEPNSCTDPRLTGPSIITNARQQPTKPVMKRSIRLKDVAVRADTTRYLPKGLHGGHGGLLIPTKPYGDGYVSPDWGWYINTTPPTPEMYHASSKVYVKNPSNNPTPHMVTRRGPSALDSPAFSKGRKGGAAHWPSVPI